MSAGRTGGTTKENDMTTKPKLYNPNRDGICVYCGEAPSGHRWIGPAPVYCPSETTVPAAPAPIETANGPLTVGMTVEILDTPSTRSQVPEVVAELGTITRLFRGDALAGMVEVRTSDGQFTIVRGVEVAPWTDPIATRSEPLDADAKPLVPGKAYRVRTRGGQIGTDHETSRSDLLVFAYVYVEDDNSRTFVWHDGEKHVGWSEDKVRSIEPVYVSGPSPEPTNCPAGDMIPESELRVMDGNR
jgi:hypothetical protein